MQQVCVPLNADLGTAVMQVLFLSDGEYHGPGSALVTAYAPPSMQAVRYPRSRLLSMPTPIPAPMPTVLTRAHYYFVSKARVHACTVPRGTTLCTQQGKHDAVSVSYVDEHGRAQQKKLLPQLLLLPSPGLEACARSTLVAAASQEVSVMASTA